MPSPNPIKPRNASAGFTLIEVMLALLVLSLLATLSWQGVSTLLRTQSQVQSNVNAAQARDLSIDQWRTDWHHLWTEPLGVQLPAHQWDGQHLLMLRQAPHQSPWTDAGIQVVAWVVRDGLWQRWASTPTTRQAELMQAWQQAQLWVQQGQDSPLANALMPATAWRLFYHRGGAWVNPASSDAQTVSDPSAILLNQSPPDAVRLVVELAERQVLTVDVAKPALALERP